jgi:2-keto-3-deoxy-L-rhamnonate aldolase
MASPPPAGVYVPVPTFFVSRKAANYSPTAAPLDLVTQAAHSLHLARSGIRGLVILGSTGEAIHLTNKERFELLSSTRKELENAGFKDYPIIAGTAAQNIEEVLDQLKSAKDADTQWGLCLVPGYFAGAATQDGIIQWFTAVADQSPIPIMVYVIPFSKSTTSLLMQTTDIIIQESRTTSKSCLQPSLPCQSTPISSDASSLMGTCLTTLRLVRIPR